jgi:hypothetical protein
LPSATSFIRSPLAQLPQSVKQIVLTFLNNRSSSSGRVPGDF